jgi:hypothetical protein
MVPTTVAMVATLVQLFAGSLDSLDSLATLPPSDSARRESPSLSGFCL